MTIVNWMDFESPCLPSSGSEARTPIPSTPCTRRRRKKRRTEAPTAAARRFYFAELVSFSARPNWKFFWVSLLSASSFLSPQGLVPSWVGILTTLLQSLLLLGSFFLLYFVCNVCFCGSDLFYLYCFGFVGNLPNGVSNWILILLLFKLTSFKILEWDTSFELTNLWLKLNYYACSLINKIYFGFVIHNCASKNRIRKKIRNQSLTIITRIIEWCFVNLWSLQLIALPNKGLHVHIDIASEFTKIYSSEKMSQHGICGGWILGRVEITPRCGWWATGMPQCRTGSVLPIKR